MEELPKLKILKTADGSTTLVLEGIDETYHSRHGALTESMHVFIQNGLDQLLKEKEPVRILEMGFGTALNALLSWRWAERNKKKVIFRSLEAFPLEQNIWRSLKFEGLKSDEADRLAALHKAEWNTPIELSEYFVLWKEHTELQSWKPPEWEADIIYYDAFGPRTQPELWTTEALKMFTEQLRPDGIFVTYCAQGQFKRNLQDLNMKVEALPGPPGKREMTRAIKND
jgi:tRNA U34 5-methylaminomethyl-2-thiouridine-forming methyltransferase MnmC